jgi:hypothetical protein
MKKKLTLIFIVFYLLLILTYKNLTYARICDSCTNSNCCGGSCFINETCQGSLLEGCWCNPAPGPTTRPDPNPTNPPRPRPSTPPGSNPIPPAPVTPTVPPDEPNCNAPCSCPGGPPPLFGYCVSPDCHGGLVCWNSGSGLSCQSCYDKGVDVALYFFEDRNFNGIWDSNEWLIDPSNSTNHDYGGRHNYGAFAQTKPIGNFPQIRVQNTKHPDRVVDLEKHPDFVIHPFEGNPCRATGFLGLKDVLHDPNSESKTAISSYWTNQVQSGSVCCSDGSCGSSIAFSNMLNEWGAMPDCCEYLHEYYYMTPAVAYGVASFPANDPGTAQIQITPPAGWTLSRNSYSRLGFGPMGNHRWGYQSQWGDWYITALGLVATPQIISLTKPSYLYLYQESNFVATFSHPWGADTIQSFQISFENQTINTDGTVDYNGSEWFVNIDFNINNNTVTAWVGDGESLSTTIHYNENKGYITSNIPIKYDDQTTYATLIGGENNTYFIKNNNNITAYLKIKFEKIPLGSAASSFFNTTLYVEDDNFYDDEVAESNSTLIQVGTNSSENGYNTFHRMGQIEIRKPPNCKNLKLNNTPFSSSKTVLLGDTVNLSAYYEQNFSYVRMGVDSSNCVSPVIQTITTSTSGEHSFNWTASALGNYIVFCGAGLSSPAIECRGQCYSLNNSPFQCLGNDGNGGTTWGEISVVNPSPWYKLKDTSLNKIGDHNIAVVQNVKKFTDSDPDDIPNTRYVIINSSSSDPGILLATGAYNPGPSYNPIPASDKNWYIGNYSNISQPFLSGLTNFYSYIKSRKQIKEINAISKINANGIYLIKTNNLTIDVNPPNYNFVLIVRNADDSDFGNTNIAINNFNSNIKSIMILAKDINFSSSVIFAYGIFIATNQFTYQSNNGLKILGNLISKKAVTLQSRSDNTRPSLFIVFKPQMYLDLLPYLSISKYDWRQLQ